VAEIKIPKDQFMALSDENKYRAAQWIADEFAKFAEKQGSDIERLGASFREALQRMS
jgi:hypothetical protein